MRASSREARDTQQKTRKPLGSTGLQIPPKFSAPETRPVARSVERLDSAQLNASRDITANFSQPAGAASIAAFAVRLPEPLPMCGNFRAIAANRHAAPPPGMSACVIDKQQCATRTFARFHLREILVAHELRQCLRNRHQQRFGRFPAAALAKFQRGIYAGHDFAISLVPPEKLIQGLEPDEIGGSQRPPFVLADEAPEPLA